MKDTRKDMEKEAGLLGYFTRNNPNNYIPVWAGMSPHGTYGSGELNMATNVARGLREAGMNAVLYDPTPEKLRGNYRYWRKQGLSPREAVLRVMHGVENPEAEARLYRLGRYAYTMSPIDALKGRSVQDLMAAATGEFGPVLRELQGLTPAETLRNYGKFKALLDRGAFDGITPGGLRDHLLKGRDAILDGKVVLGDPRQLFNPANAGAGGSYFNGALGMGYSDMPHGREPLVGGNMDLGRSVGFNANYTPGDPRPLSRSVIPFTDVGRTWADSVPFVSWFRRRAARNEMARMAAATLGIPEAELAGKKIVLLQGGAAGENIPLKMQQIHSAVGNRGDVVFLVNAGNNQFVFDNASTLARQLNAANGGARYAVTRALPPAVSRRFASAADINLSYPGSSTLSETLASTNPSMFIRDTPLNERNVGWATGKFPSLTRPFDSSGLAVRDEVDRLVAEGRKPEGFWWRDNVGTRHVPGRDYGHIVPGLRKDPELGKYRGRAIAMDAAAERAELARRLNDMLDNPRGYRRAAGSVSSKFLGALDSANQRVVSEAVRLNNGLYLGSHRVPRWLLWLSGIRPGRYPSSYGAPAWQGRATYDPRAPLFRPPQPPQPMSGGPSAAPAPIVGSGFRDFGGSVAQDAAGGYGPRPTLVDRPLSAGVSNMPKSHPLLGSIRGRLRLGMPTLYRIGKFMRLFRK